MKLTANFVLLSLCRGSRPSSSLIEAICLYYLQYALSVPTLSPELVSLSSETASRIVNDATSSPSGTSTVSFWNPGSIGVPEIRPSPELAVMVVSHLKNLHDHVSSGEREILQGCRVERMLQRGLDEGVRRKLKELEPETAEEMEAAVRECKEGLENIKLPATLSSEVDVKQALKDLHRERIIVNGVEVGGGDGDGNGNGNGSARDVEKCVRDALEKGFVAEGGSEKTAKKTNEAETLSDSIVQRVMISACRTLSGGDMQHVMSDLFLCPGVLMKPASPSLLPPSVSITVKLGRVDVSCRMHAEIVDVTMMDSGVDAPTLAYLQGTTTESIGIQVLRCEGGGRERARNKVVERSQSKGEFGRYMKVKFRAVEE